MRPRRHNVPRWRLKLLLVAGFGALGIAGPPISYPVRGAASGQTDLYVSLRYKMDGSVPRCWDEPEFRQTSLTVSAMIRFARAPPSGSPSTSADRPALSMARSSGRNATGASMGHRGFVAKDANCVKLLTEMSFAVSLQIELLRPKAPAKVALAPSAVSDTALSRVCPHPDNHGRDASFHTGPGAGPGPAVPQPSSPRPPRLRPRPPPPPPRPPSSLHRRRRRPEGWSRGGRGAFALADVAWHRAVAGLGNSTSMTASARLFFGVRRRNLSLELGAEASLPSTTRQWDGTGFSQSLIGAGAAVCEHRGALSACLLGKASQIYVSGRGSTRPAIADRPRGASGSSPGRGRPLGGPWFAAVHLDALGLLTPTTVDLNHSGVWEMSRLGALAGIDVSARFR